MSVTFSLPRGFETVSADERQAAYAAPCPACGGQTVSSQAAIRPDPGCGNCMGYGGDTGAELRLAVREAECDGTFNVANGNAAFIVQDVLNLPCEAVEYGAIDPATLLQRLAVFEPFLANGVQAPSQEQAVVITDDGVDVGATFINCGRSLDQIEGYVRRLRLLAERALERGAPEVVWG